MKAPRLIWFATAILLFSCGNDTDPTAKTPEDSFTELDNAIALQMDKFKIPGLSLAIVKNERLVYVNAYGYADKESSQVATINDLYRIASVSKPITAIAILMLVQDELISLDQKVFGTDGILGDAYGTPPNGSNKELITIRHLLDHTSGWENLPTDPMFSVVSKLQSEIIVDLVLNRPLSSAPGSTYYYLNFGYLVLGRVIEKVTNLPYENYVKSITDKMDITSLRIGGSTLAERNVGEVKYYQEEYSPYSMNIRRADAAGGWISSATDLARFIVRIDGNAIVPDVISTALLDEMYFGHDSWYHFGSLPGTSALLVKMSNNFSFVVLVNTRTEYDYELIINELYNTVISGIISKTTWPTENLF